MANQQKPRAGKKATIVKTVYRCNGCGSDHGRYKHGMALDKFPFGTKGIITRVVEGNVYVKIGNEELCFDPNELKYSSGLIEALPGADRLERHPIFEMSDSTPIIVANGKVYTIQGEFNPNNRKIDASVELGTLSSFDEMHLDRNNSLIQKLQETYSKEIWSSLSNKTGFGQTNSEVPIMIAEQVFPYLRAEGYKTKVLDMIGVKREEEKKEERKARDPFSLEKITDKLLEEIEELKQELSEESLREVSLDDRTPKQKRLDKLLDFFKGEKIEVYEGPEKVSRAVGSQTYLVSQGNITHLVPSNVGLLEKTVEVEGRSYKFGETFDLRTVEELHRNLVSQEIRNNTLATNFTREQVNKELDARFGKLSSFAGLKEYDEGDFGFTTKDGKYFIWVRVPEFIIKSHFDGNYYRFESARAGFFVSGEGENLRLVSDARSIENNDHPFLHRSKGNFAKICIGDYRLDMGGKDAGERIAKSLEQVKNIMINGYNSHNYASDYKLVDSEYSHKKVSEKEALKSGLPIVIGGKG